MLLKVLVIVAIVSVCDAQQSENHAISSQSFNREDVPLSYKYSAVHVYNTMKPITGRMPHTGFYNKPLSPKNFKTIIQYAPLLKPEEQRHLNGMYTKSSTTNKVNELHPNVADVKEIPKKNYLEPRSTSETKNTEILPHLLSHFQFIPGHNIEVLQSMNRSPGHNAVYRSYPGNGSNEKRYKINTLRHYGTYQKYQDGKNPINFQNTNIYENTTTESPKITAQPIIPKQSDGNNNVYRYGDLIPKVGIPQQIYLQKPFTKMHALFLNVARSFNQPAVPHKLILHPGANPAILANAPSHTQALMYAPGSIHLDTVYSEQKTRLFPMQKNLHNTIHS